MSREVLYIGFDGELHYNNMKLEFEANCNNIVASIVKHIKEQNELQYTFNHPFLIETHLYDHISNIISNWPKWKIPYNSTDIPENKIVYAQNVLQFIDNNPSQKNILLYKALRKTLNQKYKLEESDIFGKTLVYLRKDNYICKLIENATKQCMENNELIPEEMALHVIKQIIGYRIKCLRKAHNECGKNLSRKMNISKSQLSKIENAEIKFIRFMDIYKITVIYDCTIEYILGLASTFDQTLNEMINPINTLVYHNLISNFKYWKLINKLDVLLEEDNPEKIAKLDSLINELFPKE